MSAQIMRKMNPREIQSVRSQLGENIYRLRKAVKINQTELGKLLGIHQTAVCRIEQGVQGIEPEQLYQVARFFNVRMDQLITGAIDYSQVARHFGKAPPYPERYRKLAYAKVRELLPAVNWLTLVGGWEATDEILRVLKIKSGHISNPDQDIGISCFADLLRRMVSSGHLRDRDLHELVAQGRQESVQGFLHQVYTTQTSQMGIVQTWILNAHHYDSAFNYEVESKTATDLVVSVTLREPGVIEEYGDMGPMLCQYKKTYLADFPKYIGKSSLLVSETSCLFRGDSCCKYHFTAKQRPISN